MENRRRSAGVRLGPRAAAARPLSLARVAVIERLRAQPEPVTIASLVAATGLHENTLREHLAALVRRGLVRRHPGEAAGRGRPSWRYELVADPPPQSDYAGLAAALAGALARVLSDPSEVGRAAGLEWGRELARDRGTVAAARAHSAVLGLLADLGFAPRPNPPPAETIRLTRCPLLEAAYRHREVVCAVHLGIVEGALAEHGADSAGTWLEPFAEPGACLLALPPARAPAPPSS